jgi:membrane associated rhomboid family serine protease
MSFNDTDPSQPQFSPGEAPARPVPSNWMERRLRALPIIVGINVVVFLAWLVAAHGTDLWAFLATNFLVSTHRLQQGMWWTLVTAAFSHQQLWHLALNLIVLWSFGSVMERLLRAPVFTAFYLVAAVVSSASHCFVSSVLLHNDRLSALGASGAVSGVLIAFALLFPKNKILLFGVVPIPALIGALLFVALDLWGLTAQTRGAALPIGHGAHLGGALCGAVFWATYLRPRFGTTLSHARARPPEVSLSSEEAAEFHRIRAKLDAGGPESLTPKEVAFLRQLRERALQ